jgi:trans-2-enoyl-CoA reductase
MFRPATFASNQFRGLESFQSIRSLSIKSSKAIQFAETGRPESVLGLKEIQLPSNLEKDQILVKILAAPINPADLNVVEGVYGKKASLPAIGGSEGVGIVVEKGSGVNSLKEGDHIIPSKPTGTWTTHLVVKESDVLKVPNDLRPEYAATLSSPSTAFRLLEDFEKLKPGDWIIQNGANSTVGISVLQLAAARGIKTINVIRKRPDFAPIVEKLKALGGDTVISDEYLTTPAFRRLMSDSPKPKLALNCVGGNQATELARLLAPNGTLVTYGGMSRRPIVIPTSALIFNNITLKGFWLTQWLEQNPVEQRQKMLDSIYDLIRRDKLKIWMETWKFDSFQDALKKNDLPQKDRKVILTPQ